MDDDEATKKRALGETLAAIKRAEEKRKKKEERFRHMERK
jgi:hypothetical protein